VREEKDDKMAFAKDRFLSELAAAAPQAQFIGDRSAMEPFLADWRGRFDSSAVAVVAPRETGELAAIVRCAAEAGVGIVPQGGNTGLCGGATPAAGAVPSIIVRLARMNRIRAVDPLGNTMTVEAGCILAKAQEAANEADRLLPMSLGSEGSCEIGGNISTNAGGTAVLRYGPMRDLVLGLEVVLPDGRIFDGMKALRKDNTGYDMKQVFIGAEGTLGIVTAAVLKLFAKPRQSATAIATVSDVAASLRLLAHLRSVCGETIAQYEIMSDAQVRMV
jgi:FAD/FMN-containing dehydrogenase